MAAAPDQLTRARAVEDDLRRRLWEVEDRFTPLLRATLVERGFHGVSYVNEFEDPGETSFASSDETPVIDWVETRHIEAKELAPNVDCNPGVMRLLAELGPCLPGSLDDAEVD